MRPTNKLEKPEWTNPDASMGVTLVLIRYGSRISYHLYDLKAGVFNLPPNKKRAVPKVMSVVLITYWTASSISDSTLLEYADWYECVSLQRSSANQTTVDIWLCQKFWSV